MFEPRSNTLPQTPRTITFVITLALFTSMATAVKAQVTQTGDRNGDSAAARISDSFAEVAKRVEPAVVSIDTKVKAPEITSRGNVTPGNSDDIMDFFRRQMPRRPAYSVGSGFIVDKSGYVLTNAHVIDDAVKITIRLDSGEEFPAKIIGTDDETDVAVLKIDAGRDLPFVKLGDSDRARVGEWVLAIGSPFGLNRTVTAGIISQIKRATPYASVFQRFIQTDAAINRGNSGGPLVNLDGEVIGINSQIATTTGDYNGVGFALPSREAGSVYEQIVKFGKVRRGYLGVLLDSVKPEFAKVYGLKEARGAIVTDVRDKAAAAFVAGIQVGDVITEFDGTPVVSAQDLIAKVAATSPEKTVSVSFLREDGARMDRKTISLKLGERPIPNQRSGDDDNPPKSGADRAKLDAKPFGLTLAELTPQLAATYKLEGQKGLVVKEINPDSFIADVKASTGSEALGEGDVIQRINRVPVGDEKAFAEAVKKLRKGDAVVLHVSVFNPRTQNSELKIVQFTVQ